MAELREVVLPDIGDVKEVDVVEVLVASGDEIKADDSLISLESDKATMDVPAPFAGTVREVKVKAGDKVREGSVILMLEVVAGERDAVAAPNSVDTAADTVSETAAGEARAVESPLQASPSSVSSVSSPSSNNDRADESVAPPPPPAAPPAASAAVPAVTSAASDSSPDFSNVYASPAVRRFARELGADLTRVRGTGRKARILREDVEKFVKEALAGPAARTGAVAVAGVKLPVIDFSTFGEIEREPLTRIQRISGPSLTRSWLTIPHVTQHDECDITELEAFRQEHRARAKEQGFSLTPLAFVMKAVVAALEQFPRVNASLDGDGEHLVVKKYYHLGVAVDTGEGLVVPVIRDVDRKGVFDLARELAEVSAQARERKLKLDQVRGASFTVSSLGGIGGTFFTPIINWPEVAILGVSRSRRQPVWNGESFEPRLILPISFSYDHRVIDGAMAVRFTTYLSQVLSDIRRLIL
ncbi:MAG: 2-oxo acid dehydrogenase subunit E2 [Acidobacteria bacterium]|nr:2-oxo acid dehydrogenase subunit E2 [Acidobacteriota bacterium]